jgi:hypothetical protein
VKQHATTLGRQDSDPLAHFWTGRYATHGHTGWADGFIYQFDQECRLQVFTSWLRTDCPAPGVAIDFGCGSGEFSRLLCRRGWKVTGYDKYVRPRFTHPLFRFAHSLSTSTPTEGLCDLVISITVLDFIQDDETFLTALRDLCCLMRGSARFFFLECSPALPRPRSAYQSFRTMEVWRDELQAAGLSLEAADPFFHPEEAPVRAWEAYKQHLLCRLLRRCVNRRAFSAISKRLLRRIARHCLNKHPYAPPESSMIHVLCGRRS